MNNNDKKEDEICERIKQKKSICFTCKSCVTFTIPENIAEYGKGRGWCLTNVVPPPSEKGKDYFGFKVVELLDKCDKHKSIFPLSNG